MIQTNPPWIRFWDGLLHLRNRHFFLVDFLVICLTPALALLIRTEQLSSLEGYAQGLLVYTALSILTKLPIFLKVGLYRRYWRYASLDELVLIGKASIASSVVAGLVMFLLATYLPALPRSIPILDSLLVLLLVGGLRFSVRLTEHWRRQQVDKNATRVAIMGAGAAGNLCYREIQRSPQLGLKVVGFFDDDPLKAQANIHSVRVLGNRYEMAQMVSRHKIDQMIVAMPSVPGKVVRKIVAECERLPVEVKIMPSVSEIIRNGFTMDTLRQVQIEDLLRRDAVQTDAVAVQNLLEGKRVLVTGGGGSIGSELCRQILSCRPVKLIILGHGENSVFEINRELQTYIKKHFMVESAPQIETVIADVRFAERLHYLFKAHKPEIVFHAAAHKHVPLMEKHPTEAVDNNILGTRNVLNASVGTGVQRFVMISSDKAVNPTNVMGASKRCAELLVHQTAEQTGLPYVAVRFGNVLGSRGSVVLTFKDQIASGGPVTVTHPDMKRFFMTIPEAVQLVLQAAVLGSGGEVFMLDMGEPIKISQLATDLIELSGLEVGKDIDIVYSGLRPGEKLFEELFIEGEEYGQTAHEKIMTVSNAGVLVPANLKELIELLTTSSARNDYKAIFRLLRLLVPEYQPEKRAESSRPPEEPSTILLQQSWVNVPS
ncbi:MAG: nucleoside-diphosphate sugar epimerase/dehydratase [Chloroflexota bacterium]